MNILKHLALTTLAILTAFSSFAVTEREMDQARAITARLYLRYANDGSGYLDDVKATSMTELTSALKAKEKENLKAFNSVSVPSDYASWDKEKLVEFWSVTFFKSGALSEKGKIARSRVRKQISAMDVAAPRPAEAAKEQESAKPADAQPEQQAGALAVVDSLAQSETDILADQKAIQDDLATAPASLEKEESHTWVYVTILIILIAIVVWLVVYAARTMRHSEDTDADDPDTVRSEAHKALMAQKEQIEAKNREIESNAQTLASRDQDIQRLNQRLRDEQERCIESTRITERLKLDNQRLVEQVETLRAENSRLADSVADLKSRLAVTQQNAPVAQPKHKDDYPEPRQQASSSQPSREQKEPADDILKVIYLGRANARGIFVRADRRVSPGNTIYRLDTNDGLVGTFHVVNLPAVIQLASADPMKMLSGGCTAEDLSDSIGATGIVTESAGTAIFENGYWKVLRKARIRYE